MLGHFFDSAQQTIHVVTTKFWRNLQPEAKYFCRCPKRNFCNCNCKQNPCVA
jgi:hypothetical protein